MNIYTCLKDGRTIGMRTIDTEENWHAENWHGGQLALTFLNVSYLIILMFKQITNFTFR